MNYAPLLSTYPLVIIEDRYQGVYSSGRWLAIANATIPVDKGSRIDWALASGPSGDDLNAAAFWINPPHWIAAAATPDEAIQKLNSRLLID